MHHDHIEGEQESSAQVPERISQGRDPVQFMFLSDAHQQRIVEGQSAQETDHGKRVEHNGDLPLAPGHKIKEGCICDPEKGEKQKKLLSGVALIGNRAEYGG